MEIKRYLIPLLIPMLIITCRHDKAPDIEVCTSNDCFSLSGLENKTEHYLPFKLYQDVQEVDSIYLNGKDLNLSYGHSRPFENSGFFKLVKVYKDAVKPHDTILFVLTTKEREAAEWGLDAWTPAPFQTSLLGQEDIQPVYPRRYYGNTGVPFIFYVMDGSERKSIYADAECIPAAKKFYIKEGVGSVSIPGDQVTSSPSFDIGGKNISLAITKLTGTPDMISGEITDNRIIPANSLIRIPADLTIKIGASLTVNEGTIILIDEAININCFGPIHFIGKNENPILVTCTAKDKFWGGFQAKNADADINAEYTIFCQSGYHDSYEYQWGHAKRQALFYCENTTINLNNCYLLDHIGQVFYSLNAHLTFDKILVQRAKTGGQQNSSEVTITNSIFTDFPDDSKVYQDSDNDAFYLNYSNATIDNSVFMFAKDDGLDSGGNDGGEINVTNTLFESCFHEGAALSSQGTVVKNHHFTHCIFTNCGQGLELGFSSPNHTVIADNCQFTHNYIGIRYGDNYDWSIVNGQMFIKNSYSLYNDKDVWNMICALWSPKLENLHFENTVVSSYVEQYPGLPVLSD
jgi:hypothetical protein